MDLLGDVGNADQLTSARAEIKVLTKKVKELSETTKNLYVENEALKAEVEMYREEAAAANANSNANNNNSKSCPNNNDDVNTAEKKSNGDDGVTSEYSGDAFIRSGNGIYTDEAAVTLSNLHGVSNPLCCALNPDDTLISTGGADSNLSLCQWGAALSPSPTASIDTVKSAVRFACGAPIITTSFCQDKTIPVVAAGCMDGSVHLGSFHSGIGGLKLSKCNIVESGGDGDYNLKHERYIKCSAWSPSAPILATGSADGLVRLSKVVSSPNTDNDDNVSTLEMKEVVSLFLPGTVEALTFLDNGDTLCCYARGTSYLSYFDLKEGDGKQTKVSLNGASPTGGFDDHVSFAVMALSASPVDSTGGRFIAAATDTSRNIILEGHTSKQIRNLYGHKNDGFSQPKIAWSQNGQYLMGNTQEDTSICVWDIASSSIVKRMDQSDTYKGHGGQIRDIFSSTTSDTVVTASYDKTAKIWLRGM